MREAAKHGHVEAIAGVGYFYATGTAVAEDDVAAVEWFRKGAEKGSPKAMLNLGLALARGSGAAKDEDAGLHFIDQAAGKGLTEALYAQGETYYWGQFGRPVDYRKAFAAFQTAAHDGHLAAQTNLGVMLREGLGADKNEDAALAWFRKAAERGYAKAQGNLGHTLGVNSPDRTRRIEAVKWLILARAQHEITATKTLEELIPTWPAEDVAEAQGSADGFLQSLPPEK
jgi:hypothetical protein